MAPLTRFTLKAALALAIVAALIAPLPASAQTLYGSIAGTVTDPQGAPIPGVDRHGDEHRHRPQCRVRSPTPTGPTPSATCCPASTT